MIAPMIAYKKRNTKQGGSFDRIRFVAVCLFIFGAAVVMRLGHIQIFQYGFYAALAQNQHNLSSLLLADRGEIFVHEDGKLVPLAANKDYYLVYADPRIVKDAPKVADELSGLLQMPAGDILPHLQKSGDAYEPLKKQVERNVVEQIQNLNITGIGFERETSRYYPEKNIGSQLLGFVGYQDDLRVGQYGVEGYWDKELAGTNGFLQGTRDAGGQSITIGSKTLSQKKDGSDIVLTIDRTIQYKACTELDAAVQKHGATGGALIIMEPSTGKIIAMCGSPDFDPNAYQDVKDINVFVNPSTYNVYEPGSVFKSITMAAALNEGKITPNTTYTDTGSVQIGKYIIKNSDDKAHGVNTMTQVLEQSLNTGAIFASRQIGPEKFEEYIKRFGFGEKTGIDVKSEQSGDISALAQHKEIYMATGSFGQGISVTPIQLITAYGAIANDGMMVKPYVVDQVIHRDGTTDTTKPVTVRQVISPETAVKVQAMMVNVVQNGHGKQAGVPGYFVAGKTGTAQIPLQGARGYDPSQTIGTFVGFAPVDNPKFVMLVKIDRPKDVKFAESTAAPVFGDMARFMLNYFGVPPEVDVQKK